jgi:hypothetical protein
VNVQEIRQLTAYLKKVFENPNIRLAPKVGDAADVYVGEDEIGEMTADEDEGERSYNFRMVIQVGSDPSIQPVPTLNAFLRRRFENDKIRVVVRPKKMDSLEAYIGEEFLGVLFVENEKGRKSYIFEMPILDFEWETSE